MYHATTRQAYESIMKDGFIRKGIDGRVYLCKNPEEACRFLTVRCIPEMVVLEITLPEDATQESFDHNKTFFKCDAYYYEDDIPVDEIVNVSIWGTEREVQS